MFDLWNEGKYPYWKKMQYKWEERSEQTRELQATQYIMNTIELIIFMYIHRQN